ncbi:hypothetical protein Tco_0726251 [Tanacetum coccineum]|uniref:Uncharacterized protein n=1 Tax=Tanacetum coccineum TaxID=301880 RepID=A0ABQ4YFX5_9ASTR
MAKSLASHIRSKGRSQSEAIQIGASRLLTGVPPKWHIVLCRLSKKLRSITPVRHPCDGDCDEYWSTSWSIVEAPCPDRDRYLPYSVSLPPGLTPTPADRFR